MFLYVDPNIIVADNNGNGIDKLSKQVYLYYNLGDCYGYYLLASAFADILGDPIVSPWDILPVVPIIRGAGGIITDWHGNDPAKGDSFIASAAGLHPKSWMRVVPGSNPTGALWRRNGRNPGCHESCR